MVNCSEGFSIVLHVMIIALLIFVAICHTAYQYIAEDPGFIAAYVVIGLVYLVILIEAGCSRTRKYLSAVMNDFSLGSFIDSLKATPPEISGHIECYHYETRHRTRTYRSGGRTHTRTESYQVKVVSHRASCIIQYSSWRDLSSVSVTVAATSLTRMQLSKSYRWDNEASNAAFTRQYNAFVTANTRDVHQNHWIDFNIQGFKEYISVFTDPEQKKCWMNTCAFWIATLFLMTWIFRACYRSHSKKQKFEVIKEMSITPIHALQVDQPSLPMQFGVPMGEPGPSQVAYNNPHMASAPMAPEQYNDSRPPPSYDMVMKN